MLFDLLTANKLFSFEKDKSKGGYVLTKFAQYNYFSDPAVQPVTEIKIPAKYRGKPVVEIGRDAFRSSCELQKVFVSEGVRRIGDCAFLNCQKLSFVSLPSSL
ncbi:MAG: leucine-rich repeat domain-containing protein [Oscillospiraceae bacterium]|nr:leucine-rich repeat domain-containing protein [Oscillospiraceae bacterium]